MCIHIHKELHSYGLQYMSAMPKDIKYLSKRRRNQLITKLMEKESLQEELGHNKCSDPLKSCMSNVAFNVVEEVPNMSTKCDTVCKANIALEHENKCSEFSDESEFCAENNEKDNDSIPQDIIPAFLNISTCNNENSLREDLRALVIECNIQHNIANKLLQILRKHGHTELPTDVRVLVHTPRNASANIQCIVNGYYVHFGLSTAVERSILMYFKFIKTSDVKLHVNIDGLPISKSSGSQLWPIMASIENIDTYTLPFLIGVYHGTSKPNNANEFLSSFVNEYMFLKKNGIIVNNKKFTLAIDAILCDAPARSFITYTKGHTGYFSCSKCVQEGDFIQNRVTFPEMHNMLRTNDSFKKRAQIEHHIGNSILEKLSIGMVSQIPLDYMHLVCLGVMKRLLQLWLKGNKIVRLSTDDVDSVSQDLFALKNYIPSEFARKPRILHDVDRWKATEFRQFLLYTGIVVMKSKLPPKYYEHFLSFSVAIRIMADLKLCTKFNAYAHSLLKWFVSNYGALYGNEYLSHNVHNLLHLANDAQNYGCIDNFSCFKYENYMQKIKNKLHKCGKPLQELSNRIFEELHNPVSQLNIVQYPIVIYTKNKISYVQYDNFKIAINESDQCAILDDQSVVFILHIFQEEHELFFRVQRFLNPTSFFETPCTSERLGIFVISNKTASNVITVPITKIKRKCFKIKNTQEVGCYVIIPLLHTNN